MFLYAEDYAPILEYMRQFKKERQGPFGNGPATAFVHQLPDGTKFVFGQHEDGPEFWLELIKLAGNIAIILTAVNHVIQLVRGRLAKHAIGIETRTTRGGKVVRKLRPLSEQSTWEKIGPRDLLDDDDDDDDDISFKEASL